MTETIAPLTHPAPTQWGVDATHHEPQQVLVDLATGVIQVVARSWMHGAARAAGAAALPHATVLQTGLTLAQWIAEHPELAQHVAGDAAALGRHLMDWVRRQHEQAAQAGPES